MNSQEFEDMFEDPEARLATLNPLFTKKNQLRLISIGLAAAALLMGLAWLILR